MIIYSRKKDLHKYITYSELVILFMSILHLEGNYLCPIALLRILLFGFKGLSF